jgi:hypothetical protein
MLALEVLDLLGVILGRNGYSETNKYREIVHISKEFVLRCGRLSS